MVSRGVLLAAAAAILSTSGCDRLGSTDPAAGTERQKEYTWQVPQGFPIPAVPADNPMTWAKVELGRRLFYDTRLSGDGSVACATCHRPELAFTDGRSRARGIHGNIHPRSAMSLTNVAYNATLGWDDPGLTRLEDQIRIPMFSTRPPEMGAAGREEEIVTRLQKDRLTRRLFRRTFPGDRDPVTLRNARYALAAFERTLISGSSPYDRWAYGADPEALDKHQRNGARLFFSKRLSCFRCHAGFNLSGPVRYDGSEPVEPVFHNTALHDVDGAGGYPPPNTGLHRHTGRPSDMGKFRAPTLRNIALTAPYMHDGSIATLEEVIDHYAAGGRARVAAHSGTATDTLISGFALTPGEKADLIAFLHALTDQAFVRKAIDQAVRKP